MSYTAFEGRVTFCMKAQSLGTDLRANALNERILAAVKPTDERQKNRIAELCFLISTTDAIEFDLDALAKPALHEFKEWWEGHEGMSPVELWSRRLELPHGIFKEWDAAFEDGQRLFEVPPDHLPTNRLTPAQKKELKDPDSPLAVAAKPSRGD